MIEENKRPIEDAVEMKVFQMVIATQKHWSHNGNKRNDVGRW